MSHDVPGIFMHVFKNSFHRKIPDTAPRTGFEPVTLSLTVRCSTIELPRNAQVVI